MKKDSNDDQAVSHLEILREKKIFKVD